MLPSQHQVHKSWRQPCHLETAADASVPIPCFLQGSLPFLFFCLALKLLSVSFPFPVGSQ
jgi:hypothetical protein